MSAARQSTQFAAAALSARAMISTLTLLPDALQLFERSSRFSRSTSDSIQAGSEGRSRDRVHPVPQPQLATAGIHRASRSFLPSAMA